jgi:hypothetical protein
VTPQPPNGAPSPPQQPPAAAPPPPASTRTPPQQDNFQLTWPEAEVNRIGTRVLTDFRAAIGDHHRRLRRWATYYRRWRSMVDVPGEGEETASNVPVPFIRWNVFTKLAKEMDALFGDDAEIVAVPVGPSDYRKDVKIGKYLTWRVFNSMQLTNPFCEFVLRKLVFGRSVAYSPWCRETFEVAGKEIVDYEGPGFVPLWPGDLIVPAEEVKCIQDFSFVIRRLTITPDDLLKGEEEGRYSNITKHWKTILNLAQHGRQRQPEGQEVELEKDEAEGLMYERPLSSGEWLTVLEWYGKWRPLKSGKKDAGEWDFDRREMKTEQFVVRYLLDLNLVVGIQSLEDLYPTMKHRRPFVESSMVKDGTYWSPGLAEMLIDLEDELKVNHNLSTESAQFAATPMFGYRPASGVTADTFKAEPGLFIPLDNPATDIKELTVTANLQAATWKEQTVLAYGEKLTGLSDLQLGRQSDRPNAPRTATQTVKLLEEGNVRISLDTKVLAEDMAKILQHFWQLEFLFSSEQTWFRVTESDAEGIFPSNNGAAQLSSEDRDGRYDFRLKFASSVWSKETRKEQTLARYQLDLQNQLIVQNPRALWAITKEVHEVLGDPNFADLVPEPPAPDISVNPMEEWSRIQEGENIFVHPVDNDRLHMERHYRDYQESLTDPNRDPEAVKALETHYMAHIAQLQSKVLQQAIIEQAVAHAGQMMQNNSVPGQPGGVLAFPSGLFGAHGGIAKRPSDTTTIPSGNPVAQPPGIYGVHGNEIVHEQ